MNDLPRLVVSLVAGLMFGFGLALSGMMDPDKVLGFLDVAGAWDPSLAFVLAGAVAVSGIGTVLRMRMRGPVLAPRFEIPTQRSLDGKLIGGAALFGIGWGLAGLCPGPALASLVLGLPAIGVFVSAMVVGMALHRVTPRLASSANANRP